MDQSLKHFPEGIKQLAEKMPGKLLFFFTHHARRFWERIFRHVERAEQNVDAGEHHGKILVHGFRGIRVMPAVLHRAYEQIAQWAERPARIGMDEEIPNADKQPGHEQNPRANSSQCRECENEKFSSDINSDFEGMIPFSRNPIQLLGTVMDRVKVPQKSGVESAMPAIGPDVKYEQHGKQFSRKANRRRSYRDCSSGNEKGTQRGGRKLHNRREQQVEEIELNVNQSRAPRFIQPPEGKPAFEDGECNRGNYKDSGTVFERTPPAFKQLLHGAILAALLLLVSFKIAAALPPQRMAPAFVLPPPLLAKTSGILSWNDPESTEFEVWHSSDLINWNIYQLVYTNWISLPFTNLVPCTNIWCTLTTNADESILTNCYSEVVTNSRDFYRVRPVDKDFTFQNSADGIPTGPWAICSILSTQQPTQ